MILYLFKSTLCLLILWGIYKLFLESEKIHIFNRFYLLFSLVFSLTIPLMSFEMPSYDNSVVVFKKNIEIPAALLLATKPIETPEAPETTNWLSLVIATSALVSFVFLVRLLSNLFKIFRRIKQNPTIKWHEAKLVLIKEATLPYTFLNYIFVSREHYHNASIEPELFRHELAHVNQKHSLDILLLELLRIVFWFNPMLYLFKQSIQLNHEFLADEAVNKTCGNVSAYQYLLLSKASEASGLSLTSNLNFQITKKRLFMMTKITTRATAFIKKAVCAPCFLVLALLFANTALMAQQKRAKEAPSKVVGKLDNDTKTLYGIDNKRKKVIIMEKGGKVSEKTFDELSEDEKIRIVEPSYLEKTSPTQAELDKWKDAKIYGLWINNKRVPNSELSKYKPNDFAHFFESKLMKNAINYGKHYFQIGLMTNNYYQNVYMEEEKNESRKRSLIIFANETQKKGE